MKFFEHYIFVSGHFLLQKARYNVIKSSNRGWNQDHFKPHWKRWISKIPTIKAAIFIAKKAAFSYFFSLFALVLITIRRKKQEKLFWSVCLIYLLFLKSLKLIVKLIVVILNKNNVSNKHDWTRVKYLNVLYHNRTQKQL